MSVRKPRRKEAGSISTQEFFDERHIEAAGYHSRNGVVIRNFLSNEGIYSLDQLMQKIKEGKLTHREILNLPGVGMQAVSAMIAVLQKDGHVLHNIFWA